MSTQCKKKAISQKSHLRKPKKKGRVQSPLFYSTILYYGFGVCEYLDRKCGPEAVNLDCKRHLGKHLYCLQGKRTTPLIG